MEKTRSLNEFNLIWATTNGCKKLQTISECEINGKEYKAGETLNIPHDELCFGCVMIIPSQKKTYFFREMGLRDPFIWEFPYKENYSVHEAIEAIEASQGLFRYVYPNIPREECSVSRFHFF